MSQSVQAASQTQASSTTNVLAFSTANTVGNLLVLGSTNDGAGPTISSVVDSQGNPWSRATGITSQFSTKNTEIWYAPNCKAGANTVTVTYSGTVNSALAIAEYSGVQTSSPLDQNAIAASVDGAADTAPNSGATATTTQASELVIGFVFVGGTTGGATFTAGSGYTVDTQANDSSPGQLVAIESQTVSSTGAYSATGTLSASCQWAAAVATFLNAVAPPPPPPYIFGGRIC